MKIKPGRHFEDDDLKKRIEYPPGWEIPRRQAAFAVAKPYVIAVDPSKGQPCIMTRYWRDVLTGEDDLTGKWEAQDIHVYDPFEIPYLFEEIARVNPADEKSILAFCDRYGLLGEELHELPAGLSGILWNDTRYYDRESLQFFTQAVREMQDTMRLYYDIQTESPRLEGANIKDAVIELQPELAPRLANADHLTIARARLMIRINKHLGAVYPALRLGLDGRLYPGHTGLTLLGIAYFQLYEAIASDAQLRECPYCHSLFVPRTHRSRFCPAPAGYDGRSPCENRYNQMIARVRKSIKEGKETVEQAATRLGRAVEEVRSWVETK